MGVLDTLFTFASDGLTRVCSLDLICSPKLAVALSRKERLYLTPVQSFESNECAMRLKKVTSETPLGRCIFKAFTKCRF